jgi:hypothetical protein
VVREHWLQHEGGEDYLLSYPTRWTLEMPLEVKGHGFGENTINGNVACRLFLIRRIWNQVGMNLPIMADH